MNYKVLDKDGELLGIVTADTLAEAINSARLTYGIKMDAVVPEEEPYHHESSK